MPRLLAVLRARKHADHDQSDHGNWATGNFSQGTSRGSNGLRVFAALRMQLPTDTYQAKVYAAQAKRFPLNEKDNPAPVAPKREDFATREEYEKAFKVYDKAYDKYAQDAYKNVASATGRELLDGSLKGARSYVSAVVTADWFRDAFGDGSALGGIPPVKASTGNEAGSFRMRANPAGSIEETSLRFSKAAFMSESTLLHEIAHFATAISTTEKYEPHGVEFVKNLVYISEQIAGSEYASALQEAMVKEGIPIGN